MEWVTHSGSMFGVLFIMTSLFMWEEKKSEYIPPLWISAIFAVTLSFLIKMVVMRPRPTMLFLPFTTIADFSFPSTHAAIGFAALPILDREFPRIKWFWLIFACALAFSRLYFGLHYLSDTLGGALLGYSIGYAMMRLYQHALLQISIQAWIGA